MNRTVCSIIGCEAMKDNLHREDNDKSHPWGRGHCSTFVILFTSQSSLGPTGQPDLVQIVDKLWFTDSLSSLWILCLTANENWQDCSTLAASAYEEYDEGNLFQVSQSVGKSESRETPFPVLWSKSPLYIPWQDTPALLTPGLIFATLEILLNFFLAKKQLQFIDLLTSSSRHLDLTYVCDVGTKYSVCKKEKSKMEKKNQDAHQQQVMHGKGLFSAVHISLLIPWRKSRWWWCCGGYSGCQGCQGAWAIGWAACTGCRWIQYTIVQPIAHSGEKPNRVWACTGCNTGLYWMPLDSVTRFLCSCQSIIAYLWWTEYNNDNERQGTAKYKCRWNNNLKRSCWSWQENVSKQWRFHLLTAA